MVQKHVIFVCHVGNSLDLELGSGISRLELGSELGSGSSRLELKQK